MPPLSIAQVQTAFAPNNRPAHVQCIGHYFTHKGSGLTGSLFEDFGGRGDVGPDANRFTVADCYAPSLLSAPVPNICAVHLVQGKSTASTAAYLSSIPASTPLSTTSWAQVEKSVDDLFQELKSYDDVGYVTATKLIARKRPELVPVLDSVIYDALQLPERITLAWGHIATLVSDPVIAGELATIRSAAAAKFTRAAYPNSFNVGQIQNLSLIRVLDICIWTEHVSHRKVRPHNCLF